MKKSQDGFESSSGQRRPDLSICVLHYQYQDLTRDCLASIDTQEIPCTYEKLLVDNGSDIPMDAPPGWRLFRSASNVGNIGGQSLCFEQAQGTWVLFVANDVRLTPGCLKALWVYRDEGTLLQPRLVQSNGKVDNCGLRWVWPGYGLSQRNGQRPDAITSTCYLLHRRAWYSIGGFDEQLQSSHEDIDFSLRGRAAGYVPECLLTATATHLGNATLRHTLSNHRQVFHQARLKVIRKHYRSWNYWTRYLAIQLIDHLPRLP